MLTVALVKSRSTTLLAMPRSSPSLVQLPLLSQAEASSRWVS